MRHVLAPPYPTQACNFCEDDNLNFFRHCTDCHKYFIFLEWNKIRKKKNVYQDKEKLDNSGHFGTMEFFR